MSQTLTLNGPENYRAIQKSGVQSGACDKTAIPSKLFESDKVFIALFLNAGLLTLRENLARLKSLTEIQQVSKHP